MPAVSRGAIELTLWIVAALLSMILSAVSAGHALLWKRDPRATLGWIGICITLPILGPMLYATFGVNRVRRTALLFLEQGRLRRGAFAEKARKRQAARDAGAIEAEVLASAIVEQALPDLRALADRVTRRTLIAGNRIEPLHNGEAAYPAMLAAIADARHSIHLATYIFDSDAAGKRFIEALDSASRRGVEVRVLVDGMGEKYSWPTARSSFPPGSKVKIGRFLPLRQGAYLNLRNHRKILVVDGALAFTGGMNLSDRHLAGVESRSGPVHDLHFKVSGPVVTDLQKVFLEDWFFATRELHEDDHLFPELADVGPSTVRCIADGPDEPARKIHWILMGALACARKSVSIMTPYFIPDRSLLTALGTASLRGVDVRILLPGENNLPFMHWATRSYLWELIPYGIRIRYQPPPFVHTKLLLVDGVWSMIGSANMDPRSLRLNFELNLEVYDPELAGRLGAHFDENFARSSEVTLASLDARSLPARLRDGAAKLLSPYL